MFALITTQSCQTKKETLLIEMPCDKWSEDRKFLPILARNQIARFSDYCPLILTEVK